MLLIIFLITLIIVLAIIFDFMIPIIFSFSLVINLAYIFEVAIDFLLQFGLSQLRVFNLKGQFVIFRTSFLVKPFRLRLFTQKVRVVLFLPG